MLVDLTKREIELLVSLINDAAQGDFSFGGPPVFSVEELNLVEKLENILSMPEIPAETVKTSKKGGKKK